MVYESGFIAEQPGVQTLVVVDLEIVEYVILTQILPQLFNTAILNHLA